MLQDLPSHTRRALAAWLSLVLLSLYGNAGAQSAAAGFDHRRSNWDAWLKQHVVVAAGGNASTLRTLFDRHAEVLGATPQAQAEIRAGRFKLACLDSDGALNDAR